MISVGMVAALLALAWRTAQPAAIGEGAIELEEANCAMDGRLSLTGRARGSGRAAPGPLVVRAVSRGFPGGAWRAAAAAAPVAFRGRGWVRWRLEISDGVCREGAARPAELAAVVLTAGQDRALGGSVDDATLRASVWARSPARLLPPPRPAAQLERDRIEIGFIETSHGQAPVDPNRTTPYSVPQVIAISGQAVAQPGEVLQISVRPLPGSDIWIMDSIGSPSRGRWDAQAQFGRDGMDNFVLFELRAFLVRRRIPARKLTQEQLDTYSGDIRAVSGNVLVVRNDPPVDPARDVRTIITNVDRQRIAPSDGIEEWTTGPITSLRGQILGRPVNAGEQVYVCARDVGRADAWACKRGILDGHGYWEILPWSLGAPGARVLVTALLATRPVDPEREADRGAIHAQSRPVALRVADPPFRIDAIGDKPVSAAEGAAALSSSSLNDIRGTRDQSIPEAHVWVYKRALGAGARWIPLGAAVGVSQSRWQVHPTEIGHPGERVLLIGVLARERPSELDVTDPGPGVLGLTQPALVEVVAP